MGARDSDDDIRNYLPDLNTIMRKADPAYGEKILREAMDNPELDAALAERRKETGEGGDPADGAGKAPEAEKAGTTAPSPWVKASAEEPIDKAALPSESAPKAQAPAVAPKGTSPIKIPNAKDTRPQKRRTLPLWIFVVAATVALLSPIAMWLISSKLPPRSALEAPGSAAASGQPALPVTFDGGAAPSVQGPDSMPSAVPTSGSAAPPTAPGVPGTTAASNAHPGAKPRGTADNPHSNVVPSPPKTAESVAPPPEPPPPPTPTSTTHFEGKPLF